MPPIQGQAATAQMLSKLTVAAEKLHKSSLSTNIRFLRQNRSPDRIQQTQTDAIVDLYDAVKQLQEAVWPFLLTIPDVGAVRDAAAKAGAATVIPASSSLGAAKTALFRSK